VAGTAAPVIALAAIVAASTQFDSLPTVTVSSGDTAAARLLRRGRYLMLLSGALIGLTLVVEAGMLWSALQSLAHWRNDVSPADATTQVVAGLFLLFGSWLAKVAATALLTRQDAGAHADAASTPGQAQGQRPG
jgi:hypothetical protein